MESSVLRFLSKSNPNGENSGRFRNPSLALTRLNPLVEEFKLQDPELDFPSFSVLLCSERIDFLKLLIPSPSPLPIWGNLLAPNKTITITKIITNSVTPSPIIITFQSRGHHTLILRGLSNKQRLASRSLC